MKKLVLSLSLALSLFLVIGISTNAEEDSALDPKGRFDARVEQLKENHEANITERKANYAAKKAAAEEAQTFKLDIISTYAPELYEQYEVAFEEHMSVHEELHETNISLREEAFDATMEGLEALKDEQFELVDSGDITYRDASEHLRQYLNDQRNYYKSIREQYRTDIAELVAQNEADRVIRQGLKADLRIAITSGDSERAGEIIETLYDHLLRHSQFDKDKLAFLKSYL